MSFLCILGVHKWAADLRFVRNNLGRFTKQRGQKCAKCGRMQ